MARVTAMQALDTKIEKAQEISCACLFFVDWSQQSGPVFLHDFYSFGVDLVVEKRTDGDVACF